MNAKPARTQLVKSALGAALVALCGLVLWKMSPGEAWVNASYDYLFRFDTRSVTNRVVFIAMDNEAFDQFHQSRGQPWERGLHTRLLDKLADDGCALVVFDVFFEKSQERATDEALAHAMRRQRGIVLMAKQAEVAHPTLAGAHPTLPTEPFLGAAGTNWGVAWIGPDFDSIVRRHWPPTSPDPYPSLPSTAARLAGVPLSEGAGERWLCYYGPNGAWTKLSYSIALAQAPDYFRDRIVFIGVEPKTSVADGESEEFRTPYTRWTGESVSGAEIMITSFLNLVNKDWLQRPAWWMEGLVITIVGAMLGGFLCRVRVLVATGYAAAVAVAVGLAAILLSHFTNYWFPWLVIAAGQTPAALAFALATRKMFAVSEAAKEVVVISQPAVQPAMAQVKIPTVADVPDTPDFELVNPPFGRGAYGKVWLVRNAVGQWQALKAVYLSNFDNDPGPYEREFGGISRYKPVSDKHPGLLRVDFVSRRRADYFYYVMELGDPLEPGWEKEPSSYKPRDLVSERAKSKGRRLPIQECVRIGLSLTDALDFLHLQGLTHRDIKPQNVIFVSGQPKLADVGLIGRIRPPGQEGTSVGTPGYMPPPPESPGTPQADIYALGMMLYVLSTGQNPGFFPEIATTLVESNGRADFFPLNTVILKACQPDRAKRYTSAAEMYRALTTIQRSLNGDTTTREVLLHEQNA